MAVTRAKIIVSPAEVRRAQEHALMEMELSRFARTDLRGQFKYVYIHDAASRTFIARVESGFSHSDVRYVPGTTVLIHVTGLDDYQISEHTETR